MRSPVTQAAIAAVAAMTAFAIWSGVAGFDTVAKGCDGDAGLCRADAAEFNARA